MALTSLQSPGDVQEESNARPLANVNGTSSGPLLLLKCEQDHFLWRARTPIPLSRSSKA